MLGAGAGVASASFPSSPPLDNFATDTSPSGSWIMPALGEGSMRIEPSSRDFAGVDGTWDAALWNVSFAAPVEVWATINRAGNQDANLYADVTGGESGAVHPTSAYFADFGGTNSHGSTGEVSLFRVNSTQNETRLTFAATPYTKLARGDMIGLSIARNGVLIAWYKPAGGSWRAVVSWHDTRYRTGKIALEAIPGFSYGFSNFGGGTPTTPVASRLTTTSIRSSASSVSVGHRVTYISTVRPVRGGGTVSFVDNLAPIPGCGAEPVRLGRATCSVNYAAPGPHSVSARYTGARDGAFAGSADTHNASVVAVQPTTTTLSLSSATPPVGTSVVISARVRPAPNGGKVAFTDSGHVIRGCGRTVVNGAASCKVTFRVAGTHAIRAFYGGDALFHRSAATPARAVTVFVPPRVIVSTSRLNVTISCPSRSRGCRIRSGLAITLPGTKATSRIALDRVSARLRAGQAASLTFVLRPAQRAQLTSYLRRHRRARVGVTLRLDIRAGNGSTGTQAFSYAIRDAARLP